MATPTIIQPTTKHTSTVIFLHGLGGTGMNYEQIVKPIAPMFPHVKIMLPSAPVRKMTFNGENMNSWYDIQGFGPEFNEDDVGVKESTKTIHNLIEKEIESGIPSNKILIAGASQGGAIALYAGLTYNKPLSGILALSTYLPLHKTFKDQMHEANLSTPVLMCHGEADLVVPYQYGKMSYELLKSAHKDITLKSYPGMGHTSSLPEIFDIIQYLSQRLNEPINK